MTESTDIITEAKAANSARAEKVAELRNAIEASEARTTALKDALTEILGDAPKPKRTRKPKGEKPSGRAALGRKGLPPKPEEVPA